MCIHPYSSLIQVSLILSFFNYSFRFPLFFWGFFLYYLYLFTYFVVKWFQIYSNSFYFLVEHFHRSDITLISKGKDFSMIVTMTHKGNPVSVQSFLLIQSSSQTERRRRLSSSTSLNVTLYSYRVSFLFLFDHHGWIQDHHGCSSTNTNHVSVGTFSSGP